MALTHKTGHPGISQTGAGIEYYHLLRAAVAVAKVDPGFKGDREDIATDGGRFDL